MHRYTEYQVVNCSVLHVGYLYSLYSCMHQNVGKTLLLSGCLASHKRIHTVQFHTNADIYYKVIQFIKKYI